MSFPTSIPSYAGFNASHTLQQDSHASQHNSEQADISAIATKLGTGPATAANNTVLRGNGSGTSAWGQVEAATDIAGVLPVNAGGTGSTSSTGSGAVVLQTSPTISTPTIITPAISNPTLTGTIGGGGIYSPAITLGGQPKITDFTNAVHDHSNNAEGGTINNPCKFFVYRNAPYTDNGNVMPFDTKLFDTDNNVDVITNKGRFTAPVDGYYCFSSVVTFNFGSVGDYINIILRKNGGNFVSGSGWVSTYSSSFDEAVGLHAPLLQLAASEYVEIVPLSSGNVVVTGATPYLTWFSGFLVSTP